MQKYREGKNHSSSCAQGITYDKSGAFSFELVILCMKEGEKIKLVI